MLSDGQNHAWYRENRADMLATSILDEMGARSVGELEPPARCRAIILDSSGNNILAVRRTRPGVENYATLPGGGFENYDADPLAAIWRELSEEVNLGEEQIGLVTDRVAEFDDQWWYVGKAKPGVSVGAMGGPEAKRDASCGTYEPTWVRLEDLVTENVVPAAIRDKIASAFAKQAT